MLLSKLLKSLLFYDAIIYVYLLFNLNTIFIIFRISIYLNNCRYISILYVYKYGSKILNVIKGSYLERSNIFEYYYECRYYSLINNPGIYFIYTIVL